MCVCVRDKVGKKSMSLAGESPYLKKKRLRARKGTQGREGRGVSLAGMHVSQW